MARRKARRSSFGTVDQLKSGRWRARYVGPDGLRYSARGGFDTRRDAEGWLAQRRSEVMSGDWTPAGASRSLFGEYAESWLAGRDLKPRTNEHYEGLLKRLILPTFAAVPLKSITPATVRRWYKDLGTDTPTQRSHAYSLLRTILGSAIYDGEMKGPNPAHIRGAGNTKRVHQIEPLTPAELHALADAMPDRYRLIVLLAGWCGLRQGELFELRRSDIDVKRALVKVRRAAVRVNGRPQVSTPKSDAGIRDVVIPPHLMGDVKAHLNTYVSGLDGLLFPSASGKTLQPSTLYGKAPSETHAGHGFYRARAEIGRPELRFHDLRHTGAVLAALSGATTAELMGRLGHSTAGAAMRYQHVASERDAEIAARLSEIAARSGEA